MKTNKVLSVLLVVLMMTTMFIPTGFAVSEEPEPETAPATYTVEFRDWDGTLIVSSSVEQGADAVAPLHPQRDGYEPDGWDADFTNVQSDLTVTAAYKLLETYTLTINYLFLDGGVAAQPYIATIQKGESYDYSVDSPAVDGYDADQSSISGTLDAEDITVTVLYTPGGSTAYTVNYYTEDLNGTTYSLYRSDALSGVTGSVAEATEIDIEGFTAPAVMPSGRISADGSMTLAVYYTRNTYTVYFVTGGSYIDPVSYKYGAAVAAWPASATKSGYNFAGWDTAEPPTMPAHNMTVTAQWTAQTVGYTLVYWLENTTGTGYDYVGSAARTGTTDTAPTVPGSVPSGVSFPISSSYRTYDSAKTLSELSVAISGDGTTIVNVYYSRNICTITFKLNGGSMTIGGVTYNNSNNYVITARYGAPIASQWPSVSPTNGSLGFRGWQKGSNGTFYVTTQYYMDSDLANATLNARYSNDLKRVTIYYNFENLSGDTSGTLVGGRYYTEGTAYRQTVWTDEDTNGWNAKTFEGFTAVQSNVNLVNNTATFYYTRNSYNLSFYSNGSTISSVTYQYGAPVSSIGTPTNGPSGYMFGGWFSNQSGFGSPYVFGTMPAYNLILYAKWSPEVYAVSFDSQGGSAVAQQLVTKGGHAAEPADPEKAGYVFAYWYLESENTRFVFDREIHGNMTLMAKWVPSNEITYTVSFEDGAGTDLAAPVEVMNQTMGSTVYAEAQVIEHYLPDKVSKSLTLGAENNSIVFVYTPFISVDYTVRHVAADGSFSDEETVTTGNAVVSANYRSYPGYSPDAWQKTLQLSMNAADNVITFNYTKNADKAYTVRHYLQNLGAVGYTLADADTQVLYGPVGYRADAAENSYTGFHYNAGISRASGTITSDGALVLNLYYDRNTYTVGFDANTGSGTMAPLSGKYQSVINVPGNGYTKENYNFTGWNTAADGSGTAYAPGSALTLTENVTLYAQWQEKSKYSVAYDANGGSGTMSDPASPYYDGAPFTVMVNGFAAPADKHFTGWNTAADGSGTAYAEGSVHTITANVTLYAQWEYNDQYAVIYYGNGGTGTVADPASPYYHNNTVTVLANGFERFGYSFTGWNTESDGSGTAYAPADTFSITEDIELHAQWVKDPALWHSVAYDGNGHTGGTVPVDSDEYLQNTAVAVKSGVPERSGAVFLGWSTTQHELVTTSAEADAVVFVGGTFIIMSDTTLFAVWAEDVNGPDGGPDGVPDYLQYGIAYSGNGSTSGTVPMDSSIYSPDDDVTVLGNTGALVRTGAVFIGWSTTALPLVTQAADVPTPLYDADDTIAMAAGGITLYAVWAEDVNGPDGSPDGVPDYLEFAVAYDKNAADATGAVTDPNIYPEGYSVTVLGNGFARTGWVFDSWNTQADGLGTSASPGDSFSIENDMMFYAIWEPDTNGPDGGPDGIPDKIEYGITYDANGGDGASVPVDSNIYPEGYAAPVKFSPVPTRTGYDFLGWAESPDAAVPGYTSSGTATLSMGTEDVTLYAVWTPSVYDITYALNGGTNNPSNPATYTVESEAITLADPTRAGYNFAGWTPTDNIPAGSTGDMTFTATWSEPIVYDITYVLNGGTNNPSNPATYTVESGDIMLADPTRAGYNFAGWTPTDTIPAGSTGDLTFTATWSEAIVYDITYVLNGGTNNPSNPATYTVENGDITLADPTRAGYSFAGWTPTDTIPAGSTGDMTFTATWSEAIVYEITYVLNGGTNNPSNPAMYTVESGDITLADPARVGYNFAGWTPTDTIPAGSTGDLTFTATWSEPIVYDITYVLNGGTNNPSNPTTYTVESGDITLADPTRAGYSFAGWTPTDTIPAGSTGDLTFTATWSEAIVYDITYMLNGGTNNPSNPATYTVESEAITLADPTRVGYNFAGWMPTDTIPAGSTGDMTFTAAWSEPIVYDITYVLNGGTNNPVNPVTYTVESEAITLADPTRAGYNFAGWTPTDNIPAGSTGDMTFTATWAVKTFRVRFFAADGVTQIGATQTVNWSGAASVATAPARTGYTFDRWALTGDDASVTTSLSSVRENIDAVAKYTANAYTVTFVDHDGTVLGTDTVLHGGTAAAPADPSREGYTFTGWDMPLNNVTGDMTVTAQYEINTYTVTFVDHDGTVLAVVNVPHGGSAAAPDDPSREGYTFTGWDVPLDNVTGDLTATAQYEALPAVVEEEEIPQTGGEEPIPPVGSDQGGGWLWWLLLIPLLLLLLLWHNVTVTVYGPDDSGQEKRVRTIRKLKRKKDEVTVSLKKSDVRGGQYGAVELARIYTRRMRGNRLIVEVEGRTVLTVEVPKDAEGRFTMRIEKW